MPKWFFFFKALTIYKTLNLKCNFVPAGWAAHGALARAVSFQQSAYGGVIIGWRGTLGSAISRQKSAYGWMLRLGAGLDLSFQNQKSAYG